MSYLSQSSWGNGQLSKHALGQVSSDAYRNGARVLTDAVIGKYATVRKRPGTEYVTTTLGGVAARLVPFKVQGEGDFICEFTPLALRVLDSEGGAVQTYVTPYSGVEQFSLQYAQSEDSLYVVHEDHTPYVLSLMEGLWSWGEIDYSTPPRADSGSQDLTFTTDLVAEQGSQRAQFRLEASDDHFEPNDSGNIYRVVDRWFEVELVESNKTVLARQMFLSPTYGQSPALEYSAATSDWDGPWVLDTSYTGPRFQNLTRTEQPLNQFQLNVAGASAAVGAPSTGAPDFFGTPATGLKGQPGKLIDIDPGEPDTNAGPRLCFIMEINSPITATCLPINTLDANTGVVPDAGSKVYDYQSRTVTDGTVFQLNRASATTSTVGIAYTSTAYFDSTSLGTVQIFGGEIQITNVISPFEANYTILSSLGITDPTATSTPPEQPYPTMIIGAPVSIETGFPRAVTFHGDRLFFAGFAKFPNRVLSSKVSDHLNWAQSANDDAGMAFDIVSTNTNRVSWMLSSGRVLLLGTDTGEYIIAGTPLTPTNISVELQSTYGSRSVQPLHVGLSPTYTSRCGCTVRSMTFDYRSERFVSEDVTVFIDDQFDTSSVRELAYAVEPDTMVVMVLADGSVKALSRRIDTGVNGWSNWSLKASSVCSMPSEAGDELWFSVLRNGTYTIEKWYSGSDVYMDGWYEWTGSILLTGADHLAGQEAQIITDGAYVTDQAVGTDGTLSLPVAPVVATYVGIGYTFEVQPLFPELIDREGQTPGRVRNVTNIYVQLSSPPSGTVNGFDLSPDSPAGEDWYIVPSTGLYGTIPKVQLEQAKPLAMHVLSVTADLTINTAAGDGI